jgi:hypothetical protein
MHADTSEVCQRNDWVWRVRARRDEEWAPPVRLRRWGRRSSPGQMPARPPVSLAGLLSERMLAWSLGEWVVTSHRGRRPLVIQVPGRSGLDGHAGQRQLTAHNFAASGVQRAGTRRSAWRFPPTRSHGDGPSTRFNIWCSLGWCLIIPMIILTIQLLPSGPDATDDAPHVSRAAPTRTDHSDADQQPMDLAVGGSSPSWRAISASQSLYGEIGSLPHWVCGQRSSRFLVDPRT